MILELEYNVRFDGFHSSYLTVGKAKKQLDRFNDHAGIINIGMRGDEFVTIKSLRVVDNVYLDTSDSYGHRKQLNYKFPCLILECGDKIERFYEPKKNESRIMKFDKFKK